jgi:hypothetical protein
VAVGDRQCQSVLGQWQPVAGPVTTERGERVRYKIECTQQVWTCDEDIFLRKSESVSLRIDF